ncbi:MAG: 3'-5' exonuclease [Bacteroidales bacterium]
MKLLFFDLETTGTMFWKNGIHQMSGAVVIDGDLKESFDYRVAPNPNAQIEDSALAVSGVTREQIAAYPPMDEVYMKFVTLLGKYVDKYDRSDKFFLAGYNNVSFDDQFLRAWFKQNKDEYFGSWFWSNSIDVMVLASHYLLEKRSMMKDFKLATVAAECGISVESEALHDALYDIRLTMEVYKKVTGK